MIGERLAELRKLNGEKQQVLAKALSVSVSTVRSWEHDKSSPDHSTLVAICRRYQYFR
ncbi:MAG: helix-turn-helix domain-containing protein [Faecalibacterium sp.]